VIVYDLLSDTKINLIQHQHEIVALAFSPPGAGNSNQAGEFLVSLDFNSKPALTLRKRKRSTGAEPVQPLSLELVQGPLPPGGPHT